MTAENQLGEILELAPVPESKGSAFKAARSSAVVPIGSGSARAASANGATGAGQHAGAADSTTPKPESVPNWSASSYDLLHGLRVRDVSDKMPVRMFDALFGPDQPAKPPARKRS